MTLTDEIQRINVEARDGGDEVWTENVTNPKGDFVFYVDHRAALEAKLAALPDDIRELGWAIAIHNDYRILQQPHTFWLFTKNGYAIKGEGSTDAIALNQVRAQLGAKQR